MSQSRLVPCCRVSDNGHGTCKQDREDGLGHYGPWREIQGADYVAGIVIPADRSATPIGEGMTT